MPSICIVPAADYNSPSSRIRAYSLGVELRQLGWRVSLGLDPSADHLFIQKAVTPEILEAARVYKESGRPVIYDLDDTGGPLAARAPGELVQGLVALSSLVTTDTLARAEHIRRCYRCSNVVVIPDSIDYGLRRPEVCARSGGEALRLIWFGNPRNFRMLLPFLEPLVNVPDIKLVISTLLRSNRELHDRHPGLEPGCLSEKYPFLDFVEWTLHDFVGQLRSCDLSLLCHASNPIDDLKSNNRFVTSVCWGVPAIVTSTTEYARTACEAGIPKSIVERPADLPGVIEALRDPHARERYLATAQPIMWRKYSPRAVAEAFVEEVGKSCGCFDQARRQTPRETTSIINLETTQKASHTDTAPIAPERVSLFRPRLPVEAMESCGAVLASGWLGTGQRTSDFETAFAKTVHASHAIAVSSCTAALHLALLVAGVGPGDEVICPSLSFVATAAVANYVGARPVFADIDPRTLNVDPEQVESLIRPRTRAIMVVHYGGAPARLDEFRRMQEMYGVTIIEDAAHACGSSFRGQPIGSMGITCFSFHAVKNLTTGDGGMVTVQDSRMDERLRRLRWFGIEGSTHDRMSNTKPWEYGIEELGYKYAMNDINAAIGLAHLRHFETENSRRRQIARQYRDQLGRLELTFQEVSDVDVSSCHLSVIRIPRRRDQVALRLRQLGIRTGVHYRPIHSFAPFANCHRGDLGHTDLAYQELLSLPMHTSMTDDDVAYVCASVRAAMDER